MRVAFPFPFVAHSSFDFAWRQLTVDVPPPSPGPGPPPGPLPNCAPGIFANKSGVTCGGLVHIKEADTSVSPRNPTHVANVTAKGVHDGISEKYLTVVCGTRSFRPVCEGGWGGEATVG